MAIDPLNMIGTFSFILSALHTAYQTLKWSQSSYIKSNEVII